MILSFFFDTIIANHKIAKLWKYFKKSIFMEDKLFFQSNIWLILIDLTKFFLMKPSEFEISFSVESYNKKIAENGRNSYAVEKYSLKTIKDIDSKL